MKIDTSKTLVLVPAYNESHTIRSVLEDLKKCFENIIVVDDGSTDSTAEIARSCHVIVIRHEINLGQGAALSTGFQFFIEQANFGFLMTFDADGQHFAKDAIMMQNLIFSTRADAIVGNRFHNSGQKELKSNFFRILILKFANYMENVFAASPVRDSHNGLRVLNRTAVSILCPLQNARMAHATEIIRILSSHHCSILEYPVSINYAIKKSQLHLSH